MTLSIREVIPSRGFDPSDDAAAKRASRKFRAIESTIGTIPTHQEVLGFPGMPRIGDAHPDDPRLVMIGTPELRPIEEASGSGYDVIYTYTPGPSIVGVEPIDEDVVPWNSSVSSLFIDTWRVSAPRPVNANYPNRSSDSHDVGGFPIDSVGEPESRPVVNQTADIVQIIEGRPRYEVYRSLSNHRNRSTFLGAEPGYLLYLGADISERTRAVYELTHHFTWDEILHLRQIPKRSPEDGRPTLNSATFNAQNDAGTTVATFSAGTIAYPVWWVQPFPLLGDFTRLGLGAFTVGALTFNG